MGMRPERAAIRIFCCRRSCVVGLRMWDVWRGCGLSGCGCGLSARMLAIPAAVGSAVVRKEHSGGCRQCGCTQGCLPLNCNILAI